jgi:outer membrane protein TolC
LLLKRAIGLSSDDPIQIASHLHPPLALQLPPADSFYEELGNRRLDLAALRRGYESQEQTLRAAILAQFPKVTLGYNQAADTSNVHTSGFGVTVDLPIFDRNQGAIAVETATRRRLHDEYINRVFEARADLATALADIRSLTEQIAAAQEAIASLQRLVDTYKLAYDRGNADVISYYTAITNLGQKRLDLLKLQQQLWDNQIALELASGWYLSSSGGPATRPAPVVPSSTESKS